MNDKLREMARQVLANIPADTTGSIRMLAVRHLRDADGRRLRLPEYIEAVNWALRQRRAADLPDFSVVASQTVVFIKDHPDDDRQWSCTDGMDATDEEIDRYLGLNARVLRVGTGEG